jgi:hypothetical protein
MIRIAAVCLLIAAIFAAPVLAQEDKTEQQPKAEQADKTNQQAAPQTWQLRLRFEREKSVETNWSKPNCDQPQNHEEADLCEQRRMSEAAQKTVHLNAVQIAIGFVTLIGLALTVYYARKAACAALEAAQYGRVAALATVDAARAAQASAHSASAQTRIVEDTAKKQLRAYVGMGSFGSFESFNHDDGHYSARTRVINTGQTPAFNMRFAARIKIIPHPRADISIFTEYPLVFNSAQKISRQALFPQEFTDIPAISDEPITWEKFVGVLSDPNQKIYSFGIVEYDDAFGVHHFTHFCRWIYAISDISAMQIWDFKPDAVAGESVAQDSDAN